MKNSRKIIGKKYVRELIDIKIYNTFCSQKHFKFGLKFVFFFIVCPTLTSSRGKKQQFLNKICSRLKKVNNN